jgi:hypothetical protein
LLERGLPGAPADRHVALRRVPYDVGVALAAYEHGLRHACPEFVDEASGVTVARLSSEPDMTISGHPAPHRIGR